MNIKRLAIIMGSVICGLYLAFLLLPFALSPILNSYSQQISRLAEEATGFKIKLEKLGITTTPKLSIGLKIGSLSVKLPTDDTILSAEKINAKLSLLPILIKRIELDAISCDSIKTELKVQKDGHFYLEEFLPQPTPEQNTSSSQSIQGLPLGIKLSNRLPNINIKKYDLIFIDMPTSKKYSINGENFKISDFILDKSIKFSTVGSITLDDTKPFSFDVKLSNKLMPSLNLHDLIFTPQVTQQTTQNTTITFNIIDLFKAIHKTQLTAALKTDLQTSGSFSSPEIHGFATVNKISMLVDGKKLPESAILFKAKGNNLLLDVDLYSAQNENTSIDGTFKTGKNTNINLNFASNAKINNLFRILNTIAKSFNYNDLETLNATGNIDAKFEIKTDLKKVTSNGYFKIPTAQIVYDLYNIAIENIKADIDFTDMLNIKDISFDIMNQPLKIYGTVKKDTETDLHITANNLSIKGLVVAAGQVQLLKDNKFNSGSIFLDASVKGPLCKLTPKVDFSMNDLDIKNIPADTRITMPKAQVVINTKENTFIGNINTKSLKISNPLLAISMPEANVKIDDKNINFENTYLFFNNSRIDITGGISNYLNKKLNINVLAKGNILSKDILSIIPKEMQYMVSGTGQMPISAGITGDLKTQEISFNLKADPTNYFSLLDINSLKGKSTIINSNIRLADDTARFVNTGIYANDLNTPVAKLDGTINKISKSQDLNLHLSVPKQINFPIPGFKTSNLAIRGDVNIVGTLLTPYLKGLVSIPTITIPEMELTMSNLVANLNGPIMKGNGTLQTFKFGGIVANNLATEFALKNYSTFYLNNLIGDAFDGKISGDISYGIMDGVSTVQLKGNNMNALKAVEGAAGIKNALSGTLGFTCNIVTKGATDIDIMKNLTGDVTFDINNGKFLNIGRFDNLIYAQNILSNAILKTAITSVTNAPLIQNTAEFKSINGSLDFNNGWANIKSITSAGPLMSYYINGKYNLLNATTNVIILGRLDSKVVSLLGPLGDLSVDKLTSYIPNFGALTSVLINSMTTDPAKENTEFLPTLTNGSEDFKDFKVEFNGGLESTSSVKSFKWLSNCDTSAIDIKQDINNAVNSVKQEFQSTKESLKNTLQDSKKQLLDAKDELKNLFKF